MGEKKLEVEEDRFERLISALEAAVNALNRQAQIAEERDRKRIAVKATRVRRVPQKRVVVSDRAEAIGKAALARRRANG
jgi:hypothetical protein